MPKAIPILIIALFALYFLAMGKQLYRYFMGRYGPTTTAKAKVVEKYKDNHEHSFSRTRQKPSHYVVFEINGKRRAFKVSSFSYSGYRVGESGTLKHKGHRLIEFQ